MRNGVDFSLCQRMSKARTPAQSASDRRQFAGHSVRLQLLLQEICTGARHRNTVPLGPAHRLNVQSEARKGAVEKRIVISNAKHFARTLTWPRVANIDRQEAAKELFPKRPTSAFMGDSVASAHLCRVHISVKVEPKLVCERWWGQFLWLDRCR
jgi:hypothetical protein